jgi:hypothetical protein
MSYDRRLYGGDPSTTTKVSHTAKSLSTDSVESSGGSSLSASDESWNPYETGDGANNASLDPYDARGLWRAVVFFKYH